jgi:phospholipid:diacylglycerol acyltransferase
LRRWVESPSHGAGGPEWCETHLASWVNVAGTLLGVPKAMAALLSGEMRDTVEINQAAVYLLERVFSRSERAKLFRSWAGAVRISFPSSRRGEEILTRRGAGWNRRR